jgi:2-dehydro-3-deoxygalactonokinase
LHELFSVRTLSLFDQLAPDQLTDYLSGLLIGAEIAGARRDFRPPLSPILVIGEQTLANRYLAALHHAGLPAAVAPDEAAARGLWCIAKAAGLI